MESAASSKVELRAVRGILRRYCQALTATTVQIRSTEELSKRGIGWTSVEEPTTEGTIIFLPPAIQECESTAGNFETYKVFATHQAGHLEFGTFQFALDRPSTLFRDFRPIIAELAGGTNGALTGFGQFFGLFRDRRLATDILTIVEDARVDSLLTREYGGIRQLYRRAQDKSLSLRPPVIALPLKEALLEVLIQVSIGRLGEVFLPQVLVEPLKLAASLLRRVQTAGSTVEDTSEATIRAYCLLRQIPNMLSAAVPVDHWTNYDLSETAEIDDEALEQLLYRFFAQGEGAERTEGEEPYNSPRHIEFRGELKPELSQTLMKLSMQDGEGSGSDSGTKVTDEALKELFGKSAEIGSDERARVSPAAFARNMLKEMGRRAYLPGGLLKQDQRQPASRDRKVRIEGSGPTEEFLYDEWDYLSNHYKQEWCRLKQRVLEEGSDSFFTDTIRQYTGLVGEVKKEFEQLRTERFRKIKHLYDGDDLDFDAVIDALVERKVGAPFSERVYWRRKKLERDICVAFLLDMSASTYERISGDTAATVPPGLWTGKRIIDLEKEAIIVLVEALESIGDTYGIYGFSGHGRENVEFTIIKGVTEDFSPTIKRRIAGINPIQGTRMGPAIRHASTILERQEAKTKLLILISDGRPQDYDYGGHHTGEEWHIYNHLPSGRPWMTDKATEQMQKEYAIYDTRMALLEARLKSIIPFCLTIDKTGHDYLRVMFGDVGYEVLDNIYALPRRLPALYRKLTARV